jgi:hypothetical protein
MAKHQKPDPSKEQTKSLGIIDQPSVGEAALGKEATGFSIPSTRATTPLVPRTSSSTLPIPPSVSGNVRRR